MSLDLQRATERLYQAFSAYRGRGSARGCPCCVSQEDRARLHRAPLRQLRAEDLRRYAFKALTTWGDVDDLRHFLPRILELMSDGELGVDEPVVLGKLPYGRWERWPACEREAVEHWLDAWWLHVLNDARSWRAADALAALVVAGRPLAPLLETFAQELERSAAARASLLALVRDLAFGGSLGPWTDSATSEAVARWALTMEPAVLRAVDEEPDELDREDARARLDLLRDRFG
jgi:hypothetical protein